MLTRSGEQTSTVKHLRLRLNNMYQCQVAINFSYFQANHLLHINSSVATKIFEAISEFVTTMINKNLKRLTSCKLHKE